MQEKTAGSAKTGGRSRPHGSVYDLLAFAQAGEDLRAAAGHDAGFLYEVLKKVGCLLFLAADGWDSNECTQQSGCFRGVMCQVCHINVYLITGAKIVF